MTTRLLAAVLLALVASAPAGAAARPQPDLLVPGSDPAWRQEAKERSGRTIFLFLSEQVATAVFLASLAFGGASARLRERLTARVGRRWLRDACFAALVLLMVRAVGLPFDVSRYLLARLYGVVTQPAAAWIGDYALASAVSMAVALPLVLAFYRAVDRRPRTWWRWVAAGAVPLAVAAAAATPIYLSLFNTFQPIADRDLAGRVLALAARGGVPAGEVYEVDLSRQSRAANAFVSGLGPTAVVALGDTLLDNFSDGEVLFVTAHEMGHYVRRHVWQELAAGALMTAAGAWLLQRLCRLALARLHDRLGVDDLADVASLPLVLLAAGALGFAAMPVAGALSRHFEAEADRYALELAVPAEASPEAAASTFERLGRLGLSDPSPSPAMKYLLWSHPTLDERVEAVREFAAARRPRRAPAGP